MNQGESERRWRTGGAGSCWLRLDPASLYQALFGAIGEEAARRACIRPIPGANRSRGAFCPGQEPDMHISIAIIPPGGALREKPGVLPGRGDK